MPDVYAGAIIYASDIMDHETRLDAIDGDLVWNNATLTSGWTGTFKYRLSEAPANSMHLVISITPGTKTDSTTITTLPVGYRSNNSYDVTVACNSMAGATAQSPHLSVNTSGVVQCWGLANATGAVTFSSIVFLDN